MKKLLFVAATLGGGGAERVMLNLVNECQEKGNEVVVLRTSSKGKIDAEYNLNKNINVISFDSKYKNKGLRVIDKLIQFRKTFKKYKGYTIISFLPDINIYSIIASRGLKNRIVVSERNDPNREPANKIIRMVRDWIYKYVDYIVFQTYDAQKYFPEKIQKKSIVIPNPLNLKELPLDQQHSFDNNKIIMVCRVKPQKNIAMLINAIDDIKYCLDGTKVEIYGDGNLYRDRMKDMVKEKGLDKVIKFMGPSSDVYSKMLESTIYISTSHYEGLSNTMLEALALGVPSIVTDCPIGGAKMFITNNENGILVPCDDYKNLGEEILRLLNDRSLQEKFSVNSIKIRKQLDLNIIADKWLEVL